MKTKKIVLTLFIAMIANNNQNYSQSQDYKSNLNSTIPIKQAKSRLKAIARAYMIEKQNIKKPFELHQNWKFIKRDIYKQLAKASYLNEQNQHVINEEAIPTISNEIFAMLENLKANNLEPKNKKPAPTTSQITMKKATNVVHKHLCKQGIAQNDKPILLKKIMQELKQYKTNDNLIDKKNVIFITEKIIKQFKNHKLDISNIKSKGYLENFIATRTYKERFEDQIMAQDWNPVQ